MSCEGLVYIQFTSCGQGDHFVAARGLGIRDARLHIGGSNKTKRVQKVKQGT